MNEGGEAGYSYDIEVKTDIGVYYVEVKTSKQENSPFWWTIHELAHADTHRDKYLLIHIRDFDNEKNYVYAFNPVHDKRYRPTRLIAHLTPASNDDLKKSIFLF